MNFPVFKILEIAKCRIDAGFVYYKTVTKLIFRQNIKFFGNEKILGVAGDLGMRRTGHASRERGRKSLQGWPDAAKHGRVCPRRGEVGRESAANLPTVRKISRQCPQRGDSGEIFPRNGEFFTDLPTGWRNCRNAVHYAVF